MPQSLYALLHFACTQPALDCLPFPIPTILCTLAYCCAFPQVAPLSLQYPHALSLPICQYQLFRVFTKC